ncbi:CaiB/BaiF CoA-transferase family protein [Bradyrhizobium sp. CB82]|nr:CaiB/BaiF CoA-transferase family protein [Bradyrhizobium sp. CB82]WFU45343.1 CaiB/BaiF CoA-transferase family protein [Bradyrhizobium sp. CB82]
MSGGKRYVALNLKSEMGLDAFYKLVASADVCIEGFRPGVADRLGIGYEKLAALNSKIIYCSLTGYGQAGPLSAEAGHDINYLAVSGVLGSMGPADGPPTVPLNLLADMAGGGLLAAFAILAALHARNATGLGRYVDVAMTDGCFSFMGMHLSAWGKPAMPTRGAGLMNGRAPFYRCYRCADDRYIAVGALEPEFFSRLWSHLGLGDRPDHFDRDNWPMIEKVLAECFLRESRDAWVKKFKGVDACVSPVLDPWEAASSDYYVARFGEKGAESPAVPIFSDCELKHDRPKMRDETSLMMKELGYSAAQIQAAAPAPVDLNKMLTWPPPLK